MLGMARQDTEQHSIQIHAGHMAVSFHIDGDSGNYVQSPLCYLYNWWFAGLNHLDDVTNSAVSIKVLSPKAASVVIFILFELFPALARPTTKSCTFFTAPAVRGSRKLLPAKGAVGPLARMEEKPVL
jgi:hypothetical protein